jgi:hypothetical protein
MMTLLLWARFIVLAALLVSAAALLWAAVTEQA